MTSTNPSTAPGTDVSSTGKSEDIVTLLTADEAIVLKAKDIGLSTSKKCSTAKALATVIASLVRDRFAMTITAGVSLLKELIQFFSHAGVSNDEIFSFMTEPSSWPDPAKAGSQATALTHITVPVKLLLCQLASYTHKVLQRGHFLDEMTSYADFHAWILSLDAEIQMPPKSASDIKPATENKIPAFKVPFFRGVSLEGDKYMDDVVRSFTNHALSRYITDIQFCKENISWSGAFASRIRESVASSDTLGYLATEQENETNCAKLWAIVQDELTSSELTMARAMSLWNQVFGLKCEDRDDFQQFYSKVKGLLFKLKKVKSVAVTDDVFLRAYFAKVIQAPELQTEVKKLITDKDGDYESILQLIHDDFRAQETNDSLRDVPSVTGKSARRGKPSTVDEEPPAKKVKLAHFPANEERLIPTHFYTQMRTWYNHMIVPKPERSEATKLWMAKFHFDFKSDKRDNNNYHHNNNDRDTYRGNRDTARNDGNRNNRNHYDRGNQRDVDDRRNRRAHADASEYDNDQDYEDFLAWKENSTRSGRRGRSEELHRTEEANDDLRRRRASLFRSPA